MKHLRSCTLSSIARAEPCRAMMPTASLRMSFRGLRNEPRARLLTNWAGAQDFESLLPHVGVHMVHDLGAYWPLLPTGDFYLLGTVEFTFKTSGTVRCARAPARCSGRSGLRGLLTSTGSLHARTCSIVYYIPILLPAYAASEAPVAQRLQPLQAGDGRRHARVHAPGHAPRRVPHGRHLASRASAAAARQLSAAEEVGCRARTRLPARPSFTP